MRYHIIALSCLVAAIAVAATSQPCAACSCPTPTPFPGPPNAGHIFHGRVLAVESSGAGMAETTFRVSIVWHGAIDHELTIRHEDPNRSSCGPRFEVGEEYLVRAHDSAQEMRTDGCEGNLRISLAEIGNRFPQFGPGTPVAQNAAAQEEPVDAPDVNHSVDNGNSWLVRGALVLLALSIVLSGLMLARRRAQ